MQRLTWIISFNPQIPLRGRTCYHPHFTGEETEAKSSDMVTGPSHPTGKPGQASHACDPEPPQHTCPTRSLHFLLPGARRPLRVMPPPFLTRCHQLEGTFCISIPSPGQLDNKNAPRAKHP